MSGLVISLLLISVGASEIWLCWLGSQRRLRPNSLIGIRLGAIKASDESWYVAHESAAGIFGVGGGIAAACGAAVLLTGLDLVGTVVAVIGAIAVLVATSVAVIVALRSVKDMPDR
ncbi:MAG: SdpI family protein [Microthrixaceae bacterium]